MMLALSMITMAWIVGTCLALYLGCIVYAITAPPRQHDPQRGVGVGCLMIAAIPAVVLALLLAIGVIGEFDTLVRVLFYMTVLVVAYLLVMLIAQLIMKRRQNRYAWQPARDGDPPPPAQEPASGESN